jgi:hypothetical protein
MAGSEDALSTVEGRVMQRSGTPPEAPVQLELTRESPSRLSMGKRFVDAQGRFRIALPPGQYSLSVLRMRSVRCGASGQSQLLVEAGRSLEATILLEETREPDLRLQVMESDGVPAPLALVKVSVPSAFGDFAQTDERGRLDVCLSPEALRRTSSPLLIVSSWDGARAAVVDKAGGQRDFTLRLLPLPSVQGRIINPSRTPVRRILVDVLSHNSFTSAGTYEFMGGLFELNGLPVGPSTLVVTVDGRLRASVPIDLHPEERKALDIPVYPGVAVTGRIVDPATQQPVAGAAVAVPLFGFVTTVQDGRFTFRDLPAGENFFRISRQQSLMATQHVMLSPGQGTDLGDIAIPAP